MARYLARVYYYIVFIAMLVLAAVGVGFLVSTLLGFTPLRGNDAPPTSLQVTQTIVFIAVAWLIAGALGGVHYWLIRRDITNDPAAGAGGIRAFFLNAAELIAVWNGVPALAFAVASTGQDFSYGLPARFGYALAALALAGALEVERRRTVAGAGAPIIFQRLHVYGFQLIVLFFATYFWLVALADTIRRVLSAANLAPACPNFFGNVPNECTLPNLFAEWGAAAVVAAGFAVYWYMARRDTRSALRQAFQLIAFAYGGVILLVGVISAFTTLLRALLGDPFSWSTLAQGNLLPALLFGLLITMIYFLWLQRDGALSRMGVEATHLSILAVAAFELAAPFWVGVGWLVFRVIEITTNRDFTNQALDWAAPGAFVLGGAAYILISLYLRRRTHVTSQVAPRRAFVLALLAAGVIVGAVGAAVALFALGTAALGAPLPSWEEAARGGGASFLVGAALAGIYIWSAISERLVRPRQPAPPPVSAPVPATPVSGIETVEQVLDSLLAGAITRDQAAQRIRALLAPPAS